MNLSRLSIDQPVLAIVASIFILVVGAIANLRNERLHDAVELGSHVAE